MDEPGGPVEVALQGAVEMRARLCRAGEAHLLAQIVAALEAALARGAVEARLHRHTRAQAKLGKCLGDAGAEADDAPARLMSQTHGVLQSKVAVSSVEKVVEVGACVAATVSIVAMIIISSSIPIPLALFIITMITTRNDVSPCTKTHHRGPSRQP